MKDIKDYLYFHLGCEMINPYGQIHKLTFDNYETLLVWGKPILRHMSDMTEKERGELLSIIGEPQMYKEYEFSIGDNGFLIVFIDGSGGSFGFNPEAIKYVLKKHIDIFDLITEGIAIDKTEIKQHYECE